MLHTIGVTRRVPIRLVPKALTETEPAVVGKRALEEQNERESLLAPEVAR